MIVITGANGQLGGQIVARLLARMPAEQVGVSVRDPRQAKGLAELGVRVRYGSFTDPGSLADAFQGASQVLIVSVDKMADVAVEQHRAAIAGAVAAGVGRILYTSHMGASPESRFQACRDHAATEQALAESGVPYTSLRNGFYAASALQFLGRGLPTGSVVLPADGPVSWTAHADLAEAAAAVLADEGRFDGPTPPLTAAAACTFEDLASLATEITGRTVSRITASDEDFRRQLIGHGVPGEAADQVLGIFEASRAGEFAATDSTLAGLIGREPTSVKTVLLQTLLDPASSR